MKTKGGESASQKGLVVSKRGAQGCEPQSILVATVCHLSSGEAPGGGLIVPASASSESVTGKVSEVSL